MITELREDYEVDRDDLIELPNISEVHYELINETIKEQIENPFESKVNFVDEYFQTVKDEMDSRGENPEYEEKIKNDKRQFCQEVLMMISDKYKLDIDEDSFEDMTTSNLKALTMSAYDFFVIHYKKNLKKFFVKYIIEHISDIADILSTYRKPGDVISSSLKNKVIDERAIIVLSNLKTVIEYICSLDLRGDDVFACFNPDKYEVYILSSCMEDLVIGEDFVQGFLYVMNNEYEDDQFTSVFLAIQSSLYKHYLKK